MTNYLTKNYIIANWNIIREKLFLFFLFSYTLIHLYDTGVMEPDWFLQSYDYYIHCIDILGFPVLLILLYVFNLVIDKNYFEIKRESIKICLFILFVIVSREYNTCLALGAFLLCSDFSSIKSISRITAIGIFLGTSFVVFASLMGWAYGYAEPRFGRYGYYFGFGHYALWARQILFALILYFVSKGKKITIFEFGVFTLIQYVVFHYSTQRLTFVISIIAVIVFILIVKYEVIKINNKLIGILSLISFPMAMVGSIWISLIYDASNVILAKINKMLSGRFHLQKHAFELLDVKLFSQQVHQITDYYFYIDNGYLFALFAFGIVLTLAIIAVFSYMIWRSCKTNNTSVFSLMVAILIYLLVDNPVCDMTCIGIAFLFFPILLKEHVEEKCLAKNL